jgi:hypothetical protein
MPTGDAMKGWKQPLVFSFAWVAGVIAVMYVHTGLLISNISPQQDAFLSETYGEITGFGFVSIWAVWFVGRRLAKKP